MASITDFIRGEKDARDGKPAKLNESHEYYAGYEFQYILGEMQSKGYGNGLKETIRTAQH